MAFEFGDFVLDEAAYRLLRRGEPLRVEPKVFDVLAYLVRNRDRVVTKEELLERLWPGEFVTESVLPANVANLRKLLGDDRSGRVIKTVYGRGYQFVAPVREAAAERETARVGHSVFVGREPELDELRSALEDSLAGRGRLVLVVGEPGIGKTRTVDELAAVARERGARVLVGRCYEGEGAPTFWPWVQVLRGALRDRAPDVIRAELAQGAPEVAQLVPELRDALPEIARPGFVEPEEARFRLFDAVTTYLLGLSGTEPLMLVLDDLHWADKPSLLLLHFLARALRDARILVVGAYRDVEVRRGQPLAQLLGQLTSEPHCRRVQLAGLSLESVEAFVANVHGDVGPELARRVHARTGGNPYFVEEIVRLLESDAERGTTALPEGVRDAIGRRLDSLSEECNHVLSLASVVGREFAVATLQRIAALPTEELFALLDEARQARILEEAPRSLGHYAFEHALVRDTLYEELTTPRRAALHRAVGEALEELDAGNLEPLLTELAHHFFQAVPVGESARAARYARRAADRAIRMLAYEDGVAQCERALEALELGGADDAERCAVQIELGHALALAGERDRYRDVFEAAANLARKLGEPHLLAEAALGFGGPWEWGWGPDEKLRRMLDDAREALGDEDSSVLARVLIRLSGTHPYLNSPELRQSLGRQSIEMARRLDDRHALLEVIEGQTFEVALGLPREDWLEEREARVRELMALAQRPVRDEERLEGPRWDPEWAVHDIQVSTHIALGDMEAADREIEACQRIVDAQRQPYQRYWLLAARFGRAMGDGRYEEAVRYHAEGRAIARRMNPSIPTISLAQSIVLALDRGIEYGHPILRDPDSAERILDRIRVDFPWLTGTGQALAALAYLVLGREDDARRHYEVIAGDRFESALGDNGALSTVCRFADVASALDDADRAEVLYDLIAPYAHWNVLSTNSNEYLGSAERFLGAMAGLLERWGEAESHLRRALAFNTRIGARAHVVRTRLDLARVLGARGADPQAREQLDAAAEDIRALGLAPLGVRLERLKASRGGRA